LQATTREMKERFYLFQEETVASVTTETPLFFYFVLFLTKSRATEFYLGYCHVVFSFCVQINVKYCTRVHLLPNMG